MKALLIPLILLIVGTGAGVGAGMFLAPKADPEAADHADTHESHDDPAHKTHEVEITHKDNHGTDDHGADSHDDGHGDGHGNGIAYVKMPNQFIVPVMEDGHMSAMIIMTIAMEAMESDEAYIMSHAPKIRDGFIQEMFKHAGLGWFSGDYTRSEPMALLRKSLLAKAHSIVGDKVKAILILDIARQEV